MSDDRNSLGEFYAMFEEAALSAPTPDWVEVVTERGREILFYSSDGTGRACGGGVLIMPTDTRENRRRAKATAGCPRCPDINQGVASQELDLGQKGTYVVAVYQECGHRVAVRLDGDDGELFTVSPAPAR